MKVCRRQAEQKALPIRDSVPLFITNPTCVRTSYPKSTNLRISALRATATMTAAFVLRPSGTDELPSFNSTSRPPSPEQLLRQWFIIHTVPPLLA